MSLELSRSIRVEDGNKELSPAEAKMLQAHLEALILTMDRLGVRTISVADENGPKNGARVNLLGAKE